MTDGTPQEKAAASAGYWASVLMKIELQRGPYTFVDHEYQMEPMSNTCKRVCYMKATRGGFSEIEILKSLHGMIYHRYKEGVIYLFPTTDDVNEFSKARFGPLIAKNRVALGRFVKNTDTTSLKRVGPTAFLYLRGARLSERRGNVLESTKLKSIGGDKVVFDEVDHMSEEAIAKARGRMGDSLLREEVYIGNPIVPGLGVDAKWVLSDRRYWQRKCNTCGKFTCAEKFFFEDPERCVGVRKNGTGYIACKNCGREVFIRDGRWEPDVPSATEYMRGYNWSKLTSVKYDPLEILREFRDPPEGNLSDVYRLTLGQPHVSAENRLTVAQVLECCSRDTPVYSHPGPCAMGVDVGKKKHIVIGQRTGRDSYTIYKVAVIGEDIEWQELGDLARRFNVRSDVVDIRPYEDSARKYRQTSGHRTWLCEYKERQPQARLYNDRTGMVTVNRTEICDDTHQLVVTPGRLTIPRMCPEIKEFARQVCDPYKILDINEKSGVGTYRYVGKDDHFRHALNYFLLAASKSGVVRAGGGKKKKQKFAINDYKAAG